ncbi:MAG: SHIRT domain-containing protein, partial [Gemmiger sp.]
EKQFKVALRPKNDPIETPDGTYEFTGWTCAKLEYPLVSNTQYDRPIGKDLIIVGHWCFTPCKQFTVTYECDEGVHENVKAKLPAQQTVKAGTMITVADALTDTPVEGGTLHFTGWKLVDGDKPTEVKPGDQLTVNSDLHIRAYLEFISDVVEKPTGYGVTYEYPIGLHEDVQATLPKDPNIYAVGQEVPVAAKPADVKLSDGTVQFVTWKLKKADGNLVEVTSHDTVKMVEGGLTFVGYWQFVGNTEDSSAPAQYSVTYQYAGDVPEGVAVPENGNTYSVGQQVPLASRPDDVSDETGVWSFEGWTVDVNGEACGVGGQYPMPEGGLVITGHWKFTAAPVTPVDPEEPAAPTESAGSAPAEKQSEHPEIAQLIAEGKWGNTGSGAAASATASAAAAHVPQTSDNSSPVALVVAMIAALIALAAVVVIRRRNHNA